MSVSALLNEMDPKGRQILDGGRLLELERDLLPNESILFICRSSFPFGTLVVTPQRLIVLLQDGGADVTPFADVASFDLIEGTRKLLGGYSPTFLNTQLRNGVRVSGQGLSGGPWAIRCGRIIIAAHERYVIHGSPDPSAPAAANTAAVKEQAPDMRDRVAAQVRATITNPNADFDIAGISDELLMTYGPDVDVSAIPEDRYWDVVARHDRTRRRRR